MVSGGEKQRVSQNKTIKIKYIKVWGVQKSVFIFYEVIHQRAFFS